MNQPVLARAQQAQQQTEQLTGHAQQGAIVVGAASDPDFARLLERDLTFASPRELALDDPTWARMERLAERMAEGRATVPKHLQGNPADCLAIVIKAMQWDMDPWAVAQKTHLVNGTLGYEAQLVHAVLMKSGAIRSSFHYEYQEQGGAVLCRVGAVLRGEKEITWGEWHSSANVKVKNSPLWTTNPRQQMGYLQVKNWGRSYAPGAILGVYSVDELESDDYTPPAQAVRTGPQRKSSGNPPPPPAAKRDDNPDPETGEVAPPTATRAPAPPATGSTGNRIKEGQANYLRNKLKEAGASEQETCERYGVSRLEDLTLDAWDERRAELLAG